MFKYFLILMFLFLVNSCGLAGLDREIEYEYKNVTIKRIDKPLKTTFYYNGDKKNKILVKYQSDGFFSGYLAFEDSGRVLILSGNGYFPPSNADTTKIMFKRIDGSDNVALGKGVYYFDLYINREIEENSHSRSEIKVKYKMNKNDWW